MIAKTGDNPGWTSVPGSRMEEDIDRLHERYRTSMAEKAAELEALWPLPTSPPAKDRIPLLRQTLHRLAGSAGSYGYNDIGAQARLLEQWLSAFTGGGGGSRPGARPPLRMVQAFLQLIERLRNTAA